MSEKFLKNWIVSLTEEFNNIQGHSFENFDGEINIGKYNQYFGCDYKAFFYVSVMITFFQYFSAVIIRPVSLIKVTLLLKILW
jgi:hypothetical protein